MTISCQCTFNLLLLSSSSPSHPYIFPSPVLFPSFFYSILPLLPVPSSFPLLPSSPLTYSRPLPLLLLFFFFFTSSPSSPHPFLSISSSPFLPLPILLFSLPPSTPLPPSHLLPLLLLFTYSFFSSFSFISYSFSSFSFPSSSFISSSFFSFLSFSLPQTHFIFPLLSLFHLHSSPFSKFLTSRIYYIIQILPVVLQLKSPYIRFCPPPALSRNSEPNSSQMLAQ